MFWKKKQTATAPAGAGVAGAVPSIKAEVPPLPKAEKVKVEKLPGPRDIPVPVAKSLTTEWKLAADLVPLLKAVLRRRANEDRTFDIIIFDESEVAARQLTVKDYLTLEQHPELTLFFGWYDEAAKLVKLEQKKKLPQTKIFSETEIKQKIEALSEPGSLVLFFQAKGPQWGGPLGRGAAIVELNPTYPGKGKKYNIYTVDVIEMEPKPKGKKLWDTNNAKEIVRWVRESHCKRLY